MPSVIPIMTFDMSTAALEALFPVVNHCWVVLDNVPDEDILRRAVVGVLEEFPAMAAGIEPGWIISRFAPARTIQAPLSVFDVQKADPASIPRPLLDFFHTPLDMIKGPLSAFCLVRAADKAFIGVNVHHGACDGRGLRHLLAALAAHYSERARGGESSRPRFRTDRVPDIIYRQYSFRRRMEMIVKDIRTIAALFREPPPDMLEAPTAGPGAFTPLFFEGEESAEIRSKSRSLGITVNDLFLAALARTYHGWNRHVERLHFLVLQDLRPWGKGAPGAVIEDGEWRAVGNIVGAFFIRFFGAELDESDSLRAITRLRTKAEKDAETALAFTSLVMLPVNPFPMKPFMAFYRRLDAGWVLQKILRSSTIFSNLGTVPEEQLSFGNARALRFGFALPYIEDAGPLFTAAGVGDSISFVISHPEDFDAERFLALFKDEVFR